MLYLYRHYAPAEWQARHRREMHPLRANQITAEYLHEFFGHYLQDAPLDLLWPDSAEELGSYGTGLVEEQRAGTLPATPKRNAVTSHASSAPLSTRSTEPNRRASLSVKRCAPRLPTAPP